MTSQLQWALIIKSANQNTKQIAAAYPKRGKVAILNTLKTKGQRVRFLFTSMEEWKFSAMDVTLSHPFNPLHLEKWRCKLSIVADLQYNTTIQSN